MRFNPRTPCGVRQKFMGDGAVDRLFQSTHSLRSATPETASSRSTMTFQSTHSLRSATLRTTAVRGLSACFNPRTPCGVRQRWTCARRFSTGFNPRTPCGVRQLAVIEGYAMGAFQSTHSLRSATPRTGKMAVLLDVSIHALLAECDCARPYTLLLNKANHTLRQPP